MIQLIQLTNGKQRTAIGPGCFIDVRGCPLAEIAQMLAGLGNLSQ